MLNWLAFLKYDILPQYLLFIDKSLADFWIKFLASYNISWGRRDIFIDNLKESVSVPEFVGNCLILCES